jgi:hypothetical protein
MTALAQDTVIRPDSGSINPGSDSQTYDSSGTGGASLSIASDEIYVNSFGFGSVFYGSVTTANIDFTVRVEYDTLGLAMGPCWRAVDHNNYYYIGNYYGGLAIYTWIAGNFNNIGNTGYAMTAGDYYQVHVNHLGNTINLNMWPDGTSEPGGWMVSVTNSAFTAAGQFGIQWNSGQGRFDHLLVTDGSNVVHSIICDGYGGVFV